MYYRVSRAIRKVDSNHIIFLETTIMSNMGLFSGIEPILDQNGNRDPLQAYAPHGYDLVTDTKDVASANTERIKFIFQRHHKKAQQLNMPMLVGEWGAFHGKSEKMVETARHLVNLFEDLKFSNTYWAFYSDIADYPYFQEAIIRPYPQHISGNLLAYDYDFESGAFACSWEENIDGKAPTVIHVPNLKELSQNDIVMSPPADQIVFEYCDKGKSGKLIITPLKEAQRRSLSFSRQEKSGEDISIK